MQTRWMPAAAYDVSRGSTGRHARQGGVGRGSTAGWAGRRDSRHRVGKGGWPVLFALVVAVVLAGCGGGNDEPAATAPSSSLSPSLEPSASPSPADPVAFAEQRAVAAYEGLWAAYDAAGRAPEADPDDPQLAEFAQDRALDVLVSGLESLRERGEVIEGEVVLHPEVVELTPRDVPSEVEIEDCGDSTDWLTVDAQTGEVSDDPRGRQLVFATVRDVGDGQWKVVDFAVREVGSCG